MPWYIIAALVCAVIAPFDALYLHIKADRRREALRREREQAAGKEGAPAPEAGSKPEARQPPLKSDLD